MNITRLSDDKIERIHRASISLLDNPGVRIEHEGICERLRRAGCLPGAASNVIRFPEPLVMECVRRAPREVWLADRRGSGCRLAADAPAAVWSAPGMHLWRHGEHRLFTSQDLADAARLLDQLPDVDGVFGLALSDYPPGTGDVVGLRIMAENTTKHIRVLCFTPRGAEILCRMRDTLGPTPWFSVGFTAHGPLRWTRLALEIFEKTAGHGIPVSINGEPMAGVSAPVTLAGCAAVGNAEILAGLVVNQTLEPGRPCIHNLGLAHVFDMRSAIAITGAPENHLLAEIGAGLARFYHLPSASWVSTESMSCDEQAAAEKAAGFFTHLRAGVSLVWGVGQLESELTFSPAQAVIDQELVRAARHFARGIRANTDDLALDVVREVGIAGDFLGHEHTFTHFRSELYEPDLLWRRRRAEWITMGSPSLARRAEERADELIARPRLPCVDESVSRALRDIEHEFLKVHATAGGDALNGR